MAEKLYSYEFNGKTATLCAANHHEAVEKYRKIFPRVKGNQVKFTTWEEVAEKKTENMMRYLGL